MGEWTQPHIVGTSQHSDDKLLFSKLGIEHRSSRPAASWAINRDTAANSPLSLIRPDAVTLDIDFTAGKARHRAGESGGGAQALTRALGIKAYVKNHGKHPAIIDATGGLGQDAWALASTGCELTIIERHPVVHALLADALARALANAQTSQIARDICLLMADAEHAIASLCTPDTHAVYLDPMYPSKRRTAASKKGMQFLHALLGPLPEKESSALLLAAVSSGVSRVVVKRPKGAATLAGTECFEGQRTVVQTPNTRYDIYHCG